jgi:hypothetical protein
MRNSNLNIGLIQQRRIIPEILNMNNFKNRVECEIISLRKKKINEKFLEKRINVLNELNNDNILNLFSQLNKSNNLGKDEIENLLNKISELLILNKEINENNYIFDELIEVGFGKICHNILEKYFTIEIVDLIVKIFLYSSFNIINDINDNYIPQQCYLVSEDNFLNNYKKIFNLFNNNEEICYNLIQFFGNIIFENIINQRIFFQLGIIEMILDFINKVNLSNDLLIIFTWFFSLFNLNEVDFNSLLNIQKFFINSLTIQKNFEHNELIEILYFSITGLNNLFEKNNESLINDIFNQKLIHYLFNTNFQNEEIEILILKFLGNLTTSTPQNVEILIDNGIFNKLFNNLNNIDSSIMLCELSFWVLNNIVSERVLLLKMTENGQTHLIFNIIKNNLHSSFNYSNEIQIFLSNLIDHSSIDDLKKFIQNEQIPLIILNTIKKYIFPIQKNFIKICQISVTNIIKLIYNSNKSISELSIKKFEDEGIDEINEKIIRVCYEQKHINNDLIKEEEDLIRKCEYIRNDLYSKKLISTNLP